MNRLTLIALLVLASSCHQWQMRPVMPLAIDADREPTTMRVTRNDRSRVVLYDATILNDSLHGRKRVGYYGSAEHAEALSNVRALEVREADPNKIAVLATVIVALATATGVFLHAWAQAIN